MNNMLTHDVYAYGVIAASRMYQLQGGYPARSGYAEIEHMYRGVGGEAAAGAITLARLGVTVKLDGNWINPDEDATFLKQVFDENGVDITRLSFRACRGPKEMLVVDATSRTIFGTYGRLHEEQSWNRPVAADIQQAYVVCLDPFFGDASRQVAKIAAATGTPIVTVDCPVDDPIFTAADVTIISEEFLRNRYPDQDVDAVMTRYLVQSRGTLIFTFGHREIHFGNRADGLHTMTPYTIDPVDTTGAGDSFRAGIIYGLLQDWSTARSVRFAAALSALVCTTIPGVLHSPDAAEVLSFIEARS